MPNLSNQIALVAQLFPGDRVALKSLALRSERFRGLCEDYGLTIETLTLMEMRNLPQDSGRLDEYRRLASELQAELFEAVREANR